MPRLTPEHYAAIDEVAITAAQITPDGKLNWGSDVTHALIAVACAAAIVRCREADALEERVKALEDHRLAIAEPLYDECPCFPECSLRTGSNACVCREMDAHCAMEARIKALEDALSSVLPYLGVGSLWGRIDALLGGKP